MAKRVYTQSRWKGSKHFNKKKKTYQQTFQDDTVLTAKQKHKQKMAELTHDVKLAKAQGKGKTTRFVAGASSAASMVEDKYAAKRSDENALKQVEAMINASLNDGGPDTNSTGSGSNGNGREEGSLNGIYS